VNFPCSKCGACCRRAGNWSNGIVPVKADGSCGHLLPDDTCGIYDERPVVCNVTRGYVELFSGGGLTEKEFFRLNSMVCNEMIRADGLDSKFLIDLEKEYGETNDKTSKKVGADLDRIGEKSEA